MPILLAGLLVATVCFVMSWRSGTRTYEPPPCRICDHPGPFGEPVAGLTCCSVCWREVEDELAEALGQKIPYSFGPGQFLGIDCTPEQLVRGVPVEVWLDKAGR